MTWRAIQDSVPYSESLARLSDFAERLYWRMLATSDHKGRLPGTPTKVRALCVPLLTVEAEQVAAALDEIDQVGRILRYSAQDAAGRTMEVIELVDFEANQPRDAIRKSVPSKFPDPPRKVSAGFRNLPQASTRDGEGEGEAPDGASSETRVSAGAVAEVYEHWRAARSKTSRRYDSLSPARRQKIQTRLREFSAEDLKRAIDGVALDPWPERQRHDDIPVIFRSREQVERFLSFAEEGSPTSGPEYPRLTEPV